MKIEKKDLPKSLIELSITVDEKEFEGYHAKAFAEVQKSVELDGFRKGHAPEDIIVKRYGDMIILEEMANLAFRDAYIRAIEDHKLNPITDPKITITKIAKGNPLEFTITVPVIPEITLPDYKKIATSAIDDKETIEVTDKEVADVLEELRKGRAHAHEHNHGHDHVHGEDCNHDEEEAPAETGDHKKEEGETKKAEAELPPLDDAFAQSFGGVFQTLTDLKNKVKENLSLEKEQKLREKRRAAIVEKLVAETKAELPEVMVESELENMLAQMKADITRFGGTWEDYLSHAKKTEEEIKGTWKDDAYKRALSQILLHKIAVAEKLTATEEEVEVELVRLLAQVQDANEERAKAYLYQALTNDKVLAFLEKREK